MEFSPNSATSFRHGGTSSVWGSKGKVSGYICLKPSEVLFSETAILKVQCLVFVLKGFIVCFFIQKEFIP